MNAQEIMKREDFKQCETFHGHVCPGICIGYKAAKAGMAWLKEHRSKDEEIVAVVETDACSADAVQVLTGCTFGKGNFIYKDYGKMALTLLSRATGQGVRLVIKADAEPSHEEHMALMEKMRRDGLTEAEHKRFDELRYQRICRILETPEEELFDIRPAHMAMPGMAKIDPSVPCALCGELVMKSKLEQVEGEMVCRGCLESQ